MQTSTNTDDRKDVAIFGILLKLEKVGIGRLYCARLVSILKSLLSLKTQHLLSNTILMAWRKISKFILYFYIVDQLKMCLLILLFKNDKKNVVNVTVMLLIFIFISTKRRKQISASESWKMTHLQLTLKRERVTWEFEW